MVAKTLMMLCRYAQPSQSFWAIDFTFVLTAQRWRSLIGGSAVGCLLLVGQHLPANGQTATPGETAAPQSAPASLPAASTPANIERPTLRLGSRGAAVVELQALLKLLGYYNGAIDGIYQDSTIAAVTTFQQTAGLQPDGIVGLNTWNRLLPAAPEPMASAATTPAPAVAPSAPASNPSPATAPATAPAAAPADTAQPADTTPAAARVEPSARPTATATTASSAPIDLPVLRLGMRGSAVARLQERLRATGFFDGAIDGIFGTETQAAVRAAQQQFRLEPDGIVGAATWTALLQ
jgi:peptidoglycan hydrolase-like protein with peptidoglycan-binding domain